MARTASTLVGVRRALLAGAGALALTGCERQQSELRDALPSGHRTVGVRQIELQPGTPTAKPIVRNPYSGDLKAIAEGRRLYMWFNCAGCHFNGGGGIGPPLMDEDWIYGSDPANVFASIVEGRAQGMPAYGGRIADEEVWKIVAYVHSLSGLEPELPKGATGAALQEKPSAHLEEAPEPVKESLKEGHEIEAE